MTFGEALAHFKAKDSIEPLVVLSDDASLRKALVAWRSVSFEYGDASEGSPSAAKGTPQDAEDADIWNWMWSITTFDLKRWGIVAGLKEMQVESVFERLKGLRLIYPDGTASPKALQYLNVIVTKQLNSASKIQAPKATKK